MSQGSIHHFTSSTVVTSKTHAEAQHSQNAVLLTRAGYMRQLAAGLHTLLPLGLRVLNKIEQIVREEMDSLGAREFISPVIYPKEIWDKTGRWESIDVLYKLASRSGAELCIAATAEEVVATMAKEHIRSYRDLPYAVYQIQNKCRDELRARSGLIRGREFRMKDLYSIHLDAVQLEEFYESVCQAYMRIFTRCGIGDRTVRTFASGGVFSRFSDEFQLICDGGEDTIFVTKDRRIAINAEVAKDTEARTAAFGGKEPELSEVRAIEIGNTFKLGTRFTDAFDVSVNDSSGARRSLLMCSYGIGTSRLVGAIAEVCNDAKGLVWPHAVAPYDAHIIVLEGAAKSLANVTGLTERLRKAGISALIDDRADISAGEKFADADLLGMPYQIILGSRFDGQRVEVKARSSGAIDMVDIEVLSERLRVVES
jgi:prolyl-tRNA synthetase